MDLLIKKKGENFIEKLATIPMFYRYTDIPGSIRAGKEWIEVMN